MIKGGDVTAVRKRKTAKKTEAMCVKSIMTIILTISFSVLCFVFPDTYAETMKTVVVSVITFYFSHQIGKSSSDKQEVETQKEGKSNETRN